MKKLALRKEHLSDLSSAEMSNLVAAGPQQGEYTVHVSDGSCVCGFGAEFRVCDIDVSAGSCACGTTTYVRTVVCTVQTS